MRPFHYAICAAVVGLASAGGAAAQTCDLLASSDRAGMRLSAPTDATIASGFGLRLHPLLGIQRMHDGVDFAVAVGTPIRAAAAGVVALADREGEYGLSVVISHGTVWQTRYAHLSRIDVAIGQCVAAGDGIGAAGSTGLTDGPKLHFEVRRDTRAVDPAPLLRPPGGAR